MYSKEWARAFKERNNPDPVGVIIGTVISIDPIKISIYNGSAILSKEYNNLWIGSLIQDIINVNYVPNGAAAINGTLKLNILKVGDNVACIPSGDGQKFVVFDKVV